MFTFNKVSISKLFEEELYELEDSTLKLQKDGIEGKKIAVVVDYSEEDFAKASKDLLEKILKAAKVDMSQVEMRYAKSQACSFNFLQNQFGVDKLIVFGLKPASIGLNIRLGLYQLILFRDCQILLADDLTRIAEDVKRKTYLWRNLQKMFEL
ncbi:MAG: hypothetical protein ACPGVB_01725 [Chitinophagales bacterium]